MTIHLFVQRNRATSITAIAVLGLTALLVAPSTPARAANARPTPVLTQGAGMGDHPSAQVRLVQRALHHRGYDLGAPGVDGRFGPLTAAAVRQMQADYRLSVDGIVGAHTRRALGLTRHITKAQRGSQRQSKTTLELGSAGQAAPRRASADVTTVRGAPAELSHESASPVASLLAGACGGLIAFLVVFTVAARRRHRDPERSTTSPSLFAVEIGPRDDRRPHETSRLDYNHTSANGPSGEARPSRLAPGQRVIGYVTVPPEPGPRDDDESSRSIKATCDLCGWELLDIVRDREVGPTLERPGLGYALERIARGQADALVVSELKRLSRSIVDLGALMGWFRNARATLIALDQGIDTSTPRGQHVATTLITLSDHAQRRMAQRTNGLAELGDNRRAGRPAVRHDAELLERIAGMRASGMTLQAIADHLNAEGVPTLRGGREWRPSSIQAALGYRRPGPRDHLPPLEHAKARM